MKYVKVFLEEFKKTPIFTFKDVEKFITYNGSTGAYAKVFMSKMLKSGRTYKITKGNYSMYKDSEIIGFPFYPFYYGLGFALTHYGFWKQQSNPHVITTRNVRVGVRTFLGSNFFVSKISDNMFFGYVYVKGQNFFYPISDVEKTLIDVLYYDFNLEDYVYENLLKNINKEKIKEYLKLCNKKVNAAYIKIIRMYGRRSYLPSSST